jgi:hypothetical protein
MEQKKTGSLMILFIIINYKTLYEAEIPTGILTDERQSACLLEDSTNVSPVLVFLRPVTTAMFPAQSLTASLYSSANA